MTWRFRAIKRLGTGRKTNRNRYNTRIIAIKLMVSGKSLLNFARAGTQFLSTCLNVTSDLSWSWCPENSIACRWSRPKLDFTFYLFELQIRHKTGVRKLVLMLEPKLDFSLYLFELQIRHKTDVLKMVLNLAKAKTWFLFLPAFVESSMTRRNITLPWYSCTVYLGVYLNGMSYKKSQRSSI